MTIYSYLKDDHKKIKRLLNRIEDEGPEESEARTALFNELKVRLLGDHDPAEDNSFYLPIKENGFLDDENEIMAEEHEETRDLLHVLTDPELVGEDWYDVFLELKGEIEAHMENEEDRLFEDAQDILLEYGDPAPGKETAFDSEDDGARRNRL